MLAVRTKHMLKVQRLKEGKKILLDISAFFHEILEIASVELDDSSNHFKKLPEKLKLSIKGGDKVSALLDEEISFDGD